jgi:hypothetical protein
MNQRESLSLSGALHPGILGPNGKRILQFCICEYFMTIQTTYIPLVFMDVPEIHRILRHAYDYAEKLDKEPIGVDVCQSIGCKIEVTGDCSTYDPTEIVTRFCIRTMDETAGCLITFDSDNSLLLVGNSNGYYMVDVPNGIFTTSSAPEYDIADYAQLHGSVVSVEYAQLPVAVLEPVPAQVPSSEPKLKKKKVVTIKDV